MVSLRSPLKHRSLRQAFPDPQVKPNPCEVLSGALRTSYFSSVEMISCASQGIGG